mmetsp:Transcript_4341/g.7586  ORF Transcript_4341/g.7586 Transcript_4341/m.7586 type:complete len:389 (-) Transcript_4341:112-1278(-)
MSHKDELPCIVYEKAFDQSTKFRDVKLVQEFDDGTKKSRIIPVFSGEYGAEALLWVVSSFQKASAVLAYENADLFDNFDQCVSGVGETRWNNIAEGIEADERITAFFNSAIDEMIASLAGANAHNYLISYLTTQVTKPRNVMPNEHVVRVQEMITVANKLPGTEPRINDQQSKNIIFGTFIFAWRADYRRAKRDLGTDSLTDIVTYMTILKGLDARKDASAKKQKSPSGEDSNKQPGRGNWSKRSKRGGANSGGQKHKPQPHEDCLFHYGHKWSKCFDNPEGANFRGGRGRYSDFRGDCGGGSHGGGRGGGRRSYPGRGGRGHSSYPPSKPEQNYFIDRSGEAANNGVPSSYMGWMHPDEVENYHFDRPCPGNAKCSPNEYYCRNRLW